MLAMILASAMLAAQPSEATVTDESPVLPASYSSHFRVAANFGLASPVGELGATLTYSPVPMVQVEVGYGLGFLGNELSLMPKISLGGNAWNRVVLGAGPSLSGLTRNSSGNIPTTLWINAEVGYEFRAASGFSFLVAGGFTHALASTQSFEGCYAYCDSDHNYTPTPVAGSTFPMVRMALGFWFWPPFR